MPFRLTIEKEYQGEFWTNVYWLNVATLGDAAAPSSDIANAELASLANTVVQTRYRVDDGVPGTDNYQTVILNRPGAVSSTGQQLLPLFAVLRVDFTVAGGRPSRKYYRGVVFEANLDGPYNLVSTFVAARQTDLANAVANVAEYCDVDGQDVIAGVVFPKIAMRQLRRGSKKSVTP